MAFYTAFTRLRTWHKLRKTHSMINRYSLTALLILLWAWLTFTTNPNVRAFFGV